MSIIFPLLVIWTVSMISSIRLMLCQLSIKCWANLDFSFTIKWNIIFDTVVRYNHHRRLPDAYTQSRQQPVSVTQDHHSDSQWYKLVLNNIRQAIHLCHQGLQNSIQCYKTIIYSPKYKTAYSTYPYASK